MLIRWVSLWSLLLSAVFALEIHDVSQDWRAAVIEKELAPFKEKGLVREVIENYTNHGKYPSILRYKIDKGQLTVSYCYHHFDNPSVSQEAYEVIKNEVRRKEKYVTGAINRILAIKTLPDMVFLVEFFDAPTRKDTLELPVFTFSKQQGQLLDVLIPDFEVLRRSYHLYDQMLCASTKHSWHSKQPIAFWRGITTGAHTDQECEGYQWNISDWFVEYSWNVPDWRKFPRAQLILKSKEHWELINARFTRYFQFADLNQDFLAAMGEIPAPRVLESDHLQFKYLIDIDGNASAYARYFWILLSNSMPLKVTSEFTQWYYDGLKPYVHYVPVAPDVSDIAEKIHWARAHDDEAYAIAMQSQQFAKQYLHEDSIYSYLYHLLLAYSELFEQ